MEEIMKLFGQHQMCSQVPAIIDWYLPFVAERVRNLLRDQWRRECDNPPAGPFRDYQERFREILVNIIVLEGIFGKLVIRGMFDRGDYRIYLIRISPEGKSVNISATALLFPDDIEVFKKLVILRTLLYAHVPGLEEVATTHYPNIADLMK